MSKRIVSILAALLVFISAGCSKTNPSSAESQETLEASASAGGKDSAALKVIGAACGPDFSLIVTEDGQLLTCGEYERNILGVGLDEYVPDVQKLKVLDTDVESCAAGPNICAEIKTDGSLYIWGTNKAFFNDIEKTPIKILDSVESVSLGDVFLLALKKDGTLWAMGQNTFGQLGTGNTNDVSTPVEVMKDVKKVCTGAGFSLTLKNDGTLYGCGINFYKQFENASDTKMPWLEFGKDYGETTDVQVAPALLKKDVADIAAGATHIMVLDINGDVWCSGSNASGQIGDEYGENTGLAYVGINIYRRCSKFTKVLDKVEKVFAGYEDSFAVRKDGTLWAWGGNADAQLGDGTFQTAFQPLQVSSENFQFISSSGDHTLAIDKDGSLWGWGDNIYGQLGSGTTTYYYDYTQVADHVAEVASSGNTTLLVKEDGTLFGCGYNNYGQLGDGTITSTSEPKEIMKDVLHIAIGQGAAYSLKKDGTLWAWGNNDYGDIGNNHQENIDHTFSYDFYKEIGHDDTIPSGYKEFLVDPIINYAPTQIQSGIAQVFAVNRSGLAIAADGTLYGWGQNEASVCFGNGRDNNCCLAAPTKITGDVKAILNGKMLVKSNGELWDWEENALTEEYELAAYKDPISGVISAVDGYYWRMAVKSDGTLWIWGVVGIINEQAVTEPLQIDDHVRVISGGGTGVFLVKDDNTLYDISSMDIEDLIASYSPGKKLADGQYVQKVMGDVQFTLSVDTKDGGIYSGSTFILKTDGTLWASGSNKYGQLGDGNVFFVPKQIAINVQSE